MVEKVRIYVEGDPALRQGFRAFLKPLYDLAQSTRIKIEPPKLCGSRGDACKAFKIALKSYPDTFIILIVDSEDPVNTEPWEHLRNRDDWNSLGTNDKHCHLMVRTMEAWFIADIDTLKKFYGQEFNEASVPRTTSVEKIDKGRLESTLKAATRKTPKGEYHKTRHASQLLERLDIAKVRKAAPHCNRLFITLARIMDVSS